LKGDIKLSVFPWLALELGPATLGNPPGFGEEPFLAFNRAAVRVRLFPLLAKRLEMGRVEIDGLDLRLRKNAAGAGNWENFGRVDRPETSAGGEEGRGPMPQLAGVRVTHGRVSYQSFVIEKFNLEAGALSGQGVTPFSISFDASRGVPGEHLTLNGQFDLSADPQSRRLRLAEVSFGGLLGRQGDGSTPWEISAPSIEVALSGQSVAAPALAVSYANARITGRLQATQILDDLEATGSAALAPVVLRELAPRLGIVLPHTRDPRALAQFSASRARSSSNSASIKSTWIDISAPTPGRRLPRPRLPRSPGPAGSATHRQPMCRRLPTRRERSPWGRCISHPWIFRMCG
jgi:AsmA protein